MSTQDTLTPEIISSILLASDRMRWCVPEKVLPHLRNPPPPNDYGFLDALATLCSFVPHCESAAAVIELGAECNDLYIATSPSVQVIPSLREVVPTWIRLVQRLPATMSGADPELKDSPSNTTPLAVPVQDFIVEVYRMCHGNLLGSVQLHDEAKDLSCLSGASDEELKVLGFDVDQRHSLLECLNVLIDMAGTGLAASSVDEFARLHRAARTVAKFKRCFCEVECLRLADRLSAAVDFIIVFATSKRNQPQVLKLVQDVDWVDAASSTRDVIATINTEELFQLVSGGQLEPPREDRVSWMTSGPPLELPDSDWLAPPPKDMSFVEGSPDHLKGAGVMHCESALIQYVLDNVDNLSVDPYIGASHPSCYACVMLVRACNSSSSSSKQLQKFALGRRRGAMDPTWLCPEISPGLHDRLLASLRRDFRFLCNNERGGRARNRSLGESVWLPLRNYDMLMEVLK
ncbi:hypothetical protein V8D89_001392 [Ganoderma adspersum]